METQIKYTLCLSGCEWLAKIEDALSTLSDELGIGQVDIEQLNQGSLYSNSEAYKGYQLLWELVNNVRGPGNVHSPGDFTQYSYTQDELEETNYPEALEYLLGEGYLEVYDPIEEITNIIFEILDEYLHASPFNLVVRDLGGAQKENPLISKDI